MNKALLKSIMIMHGDSTKDMACFLNISPQSVYNKMNEVILSSGKKAEFGKNEIKLICERYNLTEKQLKLIFFS